MVGYVLIPVIYVFIGICIDVSNGTCALLYSSIYDLNKQDYEKYLKAYLLSGLFHYIYRYDDVGLV